MPNHLYDIDERTRLGLPTIPPPSLIPAASPGDRTMEEAPLITRHRSKTKRWQQRFVASDTLESPSFLQQSSAGVGH